MPKHNINGPLSEFYHYIWGYIIPLLLIIINNNLKKQNLYFENCGDIVDKVSVQLFKDIGIKANFNYNLKHNSEFDISYKVLRLDSHFTGLAYLSSKNYFMYFVNCSILLLKANQFPMFRLSNNLISQFNNLRYFLTEIIYSKFKHFINKYKDKTIIIKRELRENNDGTILKDYGATRKSLSGIDKFMEDNNSLFDFEIYDAAKISLIEQIACFMIAKNVIGVRGAEFAHLVWMQKEARAILINTDPWDSPTFILSRINKVDFKIIESTEGRHPDINNYSISKLLLK
ncbi:glycosyltransferase 61 family protein [Candidatus Kapabacteria bacterium]|nr:glycosyltransferase 61 family protein [Candidatus Kapabacteria bacterium]